MKTSAQLQPLLAAGCPALRRYRADHRIRLRARDGSGGAQTPSNGLGKGEKELADQAACDAIRGMFDLINICGEVVIGEGIKDNAPGIFKGETSGYVGPGKR